MRISTKGIYALEAMIELSSRDESCVSIRDIVEARNCSVKYLEQLFNRLKKANLIKSVRGKDGGYQLAKQAEYISAKDIILAVEENLDPVSCLSKECGRSSFCPTQNVWLGIQKEIYQVLENKNLKYLSEVYKREV